MNTKQKRAYNKKLTQGIKKNKDALLGMLTKEWDTTQKQAKKEQIVRKVKEATYATGKTILKLLAISGTCSVALIAPNIFVAYDKLGKRKGFLNKRNSQKELSYLKKQNYIRFIKKENNYYKIEITDRGLEKAMQNSFKNLSPYKNKKWDGFWRVVIFDIPERHKWARDGFRKKLKDLGFHQLQHSVFISPHPCEKELNFLISVFSINPHTITLKTKHISNNNTLKKDFGIT